MMLSMKISLGKPTSHSVMLSWWEVSMTRRKHRESMGNNQHNVGRYLPTTSTTVRGVRYLRKERKKEKTIQARWGTIIALQQEFFFSWLN